MNGRWRYSPKAHEDLNAHVNGLISETHSVASVRQHLEESQENEGTSIGVAPGSIDSAKTIVKSVLKSRLREYASDAIFAGRKKNGEHLHKFDSSLTNAKECSWLDQEIEFPEFSLLLRNLQVRHDAASRDSDVDKAMSSLRKAIKVLEDSQWSVAALLSVRQGLGRILELADAMNMYVAPKHRTIRSMLQRQIGLDPDDPEYASGAEDIIGVFEKLIAGFKKQKEELDASCEGSQISKAERLIRQLQKHMEPADQGETIPPLTDPTLAVILQSLLCIMRRSPEVCEEVVELGVVHVVTRLFLAESLDYKVQNPNPDYPEVQCGLARVLAEVAYQSAQAQEQSYSDKAAEMTAVRSLKGLERQPAHRTSQRRPLSAEAQSAVKTLVTGLRASLRRSEHAAVWAVATALHRLAEQPIACAQLLEAGLQPVLQEARELYGGLPSNGRLPLALPRPKPRAPSISTAVPNFVGAVAAPPALQRPSKSVKERWMVSSASAPELPMQARTRNSVEMLGGTPAARHAPQKQLMRAGRMSLTLQDDLDPEGYPSLLWLIAEDGVDKESFYRVCDRSFIMLQLQKLSSTIEKVRLQLPESNPLQKTVSSLSRGTIGTPCGSRGNGTTHSADSRGGLNSRDAQGGRPRLSFLSSPPRGTHQLT
jgi:hypothetical protein